MFQLISTYLFPKLMKNDLDKIDRTVKVTFVSVDSKYTFPLCHLSEFGKAVVLNC